MTKTAKEIIRHHLKRVYFNGSTDTIARQNGVIPNDTKLGETQIEVELNQALKDLEAIHQQEIAEAKLGIVVNSLNLLNMESIHTVEQALIGDLARLESELEALKELEAEL